MEIEGGSLKNVIEQLEGKKIINFKSNADKDLFNQLLGKDKLEILDIKVLEHIINRMEVNKAKACTFSKDFLDNDKSENDYLNFLLLDKFGAADNKFTDYNTKIELYSNYDKEFKKEANSLEVYRGGVPIPKNKRYRVFEKLRSINNEMEKFNKSIKNFMSLYLNNQSELSFSFLPENKKKSNNNPSNPTESIVKQNKALHDDLSQYYTNRSKRPNNFFTWYGKDSKLKETLRIMEHINSGKPIEDYDLTGASKDGKLGNIIKSHLAKIKLGSIKDDGIELLPPQ